MSETLRVVLVDDHEVVRDDVAIEAVGVPLAIRRSSSSGRSADG